MDAILHNILMAAQPLGDVIYLLIATAAIDTLSGLWAAYKSDALQWSFVDTFIKSHVVDKWAPIIGTLLGGIAIGGTDSAIGTALVAAGVAQIAAYERATIASVFGNIAAAGKQTKGLPSSVTPPKV